MPAAVQAVRCSFSEFSARVAELVDQLSLPTAPDEKDTDETSDHRPRRAPHAGMVATIRCNTCGRRIAWPDTRCMHVVGTIYDDTSGEVHEYRDCRCGSTLLFILEDRRDETEFGHRRRALFDQWLERLAHRTRRPRDELRGVLRALFRIAMNPHQLRAPRPESAPRSRGERLGDGQEHGARVEVGPEPSDLGRGGRVPRSYRVAK